MERVFLLLILLMPLASGCTQLEDARLEGRLRRMARAAYVGSPGDCNGVVHNSDYARGFEEGYYDVASGGDGCPPALPPKKYWSATYASPVGQEHVEAWFQGFRDGAATATAEGAASYGVLHISAEHRVARPMKFVAPTLPQPPKPTPPPIEPEPLSIEGPSPKGQGETPAEALPSTPLEPPTPPARPRRPPPRPTPPPLAPLDKEPSAPARKTSATPSSEITRVGFEPLTPNPRSAVHRSDATAEQKSPRTAPSQGFRLNLPRINALKR